MFITICKIDDQYQLNMWCRVPEAGALGQPRGMGWGGRWGGFQGGSTHVHPWLIHVDVWQKPPYFVK